jgi:molybdopterin adenylyltransferase
MDPMRVAILTVSDRCSRGEAEDGSGPALEGMVVSALGGVVVARACVPDEVDRIASALRAWADGAGAPDLVLTTGGTGLAPRDVTPEATLGVLERRHSGLMELVRRRGSEQTMRAYLSRGEAGTRGRTLIINLPGSIRGATDSLGGLLDLLPHAIETLRGEVQDDGRPDAVPTRGRVVRHDDD